MNKKGLIHVSNWNTIYLKCDQFLLIENLSGLWNAVTNQQHICDSTKERNSNKKSVMTEGVVPGIGKLNLINQDVSTHSNI